MINHRYAPAVVLLGFVLLAACGQDRDLAGVYQAATAEPERHIVTLTLKEGGTGFWAVDDESVAFRWNFQSARIQLHTKAGGVITGQLTPEGVIHIRLPDVGDFNFARLKPGQ